MGNWSVEAGGMVSDPDVTINHDMFVYKKDVQEKLFKKWENWDEIQQDNVTPQCVIKLAMPGIKHA